MHVLRISCSCPSESEGLPASASSGTVSEAGRKAGTGPVAERLSAILHEGGKGRRFVKSSSGTGAPGVSRRLCLANRRVRGRPSTSHPHHSMITAVFFDLDDTLCDDL